MILNTLAESPHSPKNNHKFSFLLCFPCSKKLCVSAPLRLNLLMEVDWELLSVKHRKGRQFNFIVLGVILGVILFEKSFQR